MGKTVHFACPTSCTTTTTITPSSSYCSTSPLSSPSSSSSVVSSSKLKKSYQPLLSSTLVEINHNINKNCEENIHEIMYNGHENNEKNYENERLSSSQSSSSSPRTALPTTITTTAIITRIPSISGKTSLYPSTSALNDQQLLEQSQSRHGNIEGEREGESGLIYIERHGNETETGGHSSVDGIGDEDDQRNGSQNNLSAHTIDYDSMTEVVFDDLNETEPTSLILGYCKKKFLRWYVNLLGIFGLYPASSDATCLQYTSSYVQTIVILIVLCYGYYFQYCSSFRRDRGFILNNNSIILRTIVLNSHYRDALDFGEILFVHVIPSGLHLFGFIFAAYVFRIADNEQLQNLIERVFLLSNRPKRLCIMLWLHISAGFFWLTLFTFYVVLMVNVQQGNLKMGIFSSSSPLSLPSSTSPSSSSTFGFPESSKVSTTNKNYGSMIALIVTTFAQDAIQMIVLTTYCIECYLLRLHLRTLKEKLMQHTIETIDWMREILEFRKLLNHLNKRVTIPVCFFTVMNLSYAFAGLVYVFKEYDFNAPIKIFIINLGNVLLWLIIGMIPFFQAATVTRECQSIQATGHQIRIRPFVYRNTPSIDLDSTLLFASSLNMSAKLYRMPIQVNYLCFTILIISLIVITLGMCLNISLGII